MSGGPLLVDHDLRLAGCVAWVGRSSLEVVIELADRPPAAGDAAPAGLGAEGWQGGAGSGGEPATAAAPHAAAGSGGWRRRGVAQFVLVVRGGTKEQPLRARPLAPAAPWEVTLCAHAAARQEARRAKRAADSAAAHPAEVGSSGSSSKAAGGPSSTDAALLAALVSRAGQARAEAWQRTNAAAGGGAIAGSAPVPMSATCLRAPVIMHYQVARRQARSGLLGAAPVAD